jgi:hypothetical protein
MGGEGMGHNKHEKKELGPSLLGQDAEYKFRDPVLKEAVQLVVSSPVLLSSSSAFCLLLFIQQ